MAVFGVPVAHEDDALRAVRAAWEMHDALGAAEDVLNFALGRALRARVAADRGEHDEALDLALRL